MLTGTKLEDTSVISREDNRTVRVDEINEYRTHREELWKSEQRRVFADREAIGYEYVQAFINNISHE